MTRPSCLRDRLAEALLWWAVLWWAIWFGGQLFNAMTVVTAWTANPPSSVYAFFGLMRDAPRWPFFQWFNITWVFVLLIGALVAERDWPRIRVRRTALAALLALVAAIWLAGFLFPTLGSITAEPSKLEPLEMIDTVLLWRRANWLRLALELCGLITVLRALTAKPAKPLPP